MSLLVVNLDGGQTDAGLSLAPIGALFTQSGVLRPNAFGVAALGSPGMAVEVSGSDDDDIAIIKTSDGATYYVKNTMPEPVTILANSSGVTKTDAVVLFTDLTDGDASNAGSPGAAQFIAVRRAGVSTGIPTDGEIDAATSNNPWLKLREVTVEHGAGEIENEDLGYSVAQASILGQLIEPQSLDTDKLADLAVTDEKMAGAVWQNWTPTVSGNGAMTVTLTSTNLARWRQVGRGPGSLVYFQCNLTVTIGGTPNTTVSVSLPPGAPAPQNTPSAAISVATTQSGGAFAGGAGLVDNSNGIRVRRPDSSAWTSGSGAVVYASGFYEVGS